MKILVINSGSSSIKYQFFTGGKSEPLCKGVVERIGFKNSFLSHHKRRNKPIAIRVDAPDHNRSIKQILDALTNPASGVIRSYKQISGIGHRVVHGAEIFTRPTVINDRVIKAVKKFSKLAPLHNPPAILGIDACQKFAGAIPQVAVFDTAFHQTMPSSAYIYGLPYRYYRNFKIRRYGFHGMSHKFVAQQAAIRLKKNLNSLKLVTCHLGNGCSITAVKNGISIDTSMGFTPLEGLLMGTRCGDIDPAVILYIMEREGLGTKQMGELLNKRSGLKGLSGISSDMRDILKAAGKGNRRAGLALDIFIYRIKKYIGSYTASMNGLDAVVLTAGIGENASIIRDRIRRDLNIFLKEFDAKLLVIPTNEELMIARETAEAISRLKI